MTFFYYFLFFKRVFFSGLFRSLYYRPWIPSLLQHQGKQDQKRLSIRIIYNRERIEIILVEKYS